MANVKQIRRDTGDVVVDEERRKKYALANGIGIFELQFKKNFPFDMRIFGYDDLVVRRINNNHGNEVRTVAEIVPSGYLTFSPNEEQVLVAFIPDTPKNRKLLALTIYTADFYIVSLTLKGNVEVPGEQIREEILEFAKSLGVQLPTAAQRNPRRNAPVVAPRFKTLQDVEDTIHKKHESLVEALKSEHGEKFKDSSVYKNVVGKEIESIATNLGLKERIIKAPAVVKPIKDTPKRMPVIKAPVKEEESLVS
jgi:hypothetical protein